MKEGVLSTMIEWNDYLEMLRTWFHPGRRRGSIRRWTSIGSRSHLSWNDSGCGAQLGRWHHVWGNIWNTPKYVHVNHKEAKGKMAKDSVNCVLQGRMLTKGHTRGDAQASHWPMQWTGGNRAGTRARARASRKQEEGGNRDGDTEGKQAGKDDKQEKEMVV